MKKNGVFRNKAHIPFIKVVPVIDQYHMIGKKTSLLRLNAYSPAAFIQVWQK